MGILSSSDVLSGIWVECTELQDQELKDLDEILPTVLLQSKAPSTVKKYTGAFSHWKAWVKQKSEVQVFPAKPLHIALYLTYLIRNP